MLDNYTPRNKSLAGNAPNATRTSITLVEDDAELREILTRALQREGYRVKAASDLAEARRLSRESPSMLYIIDLGLPDGNGLQIIRELRAESDASVIILSGRDDTIDEVVGLELGADDYLVKPATIKVLLARITAVLRRTQSGKEYSQEHSNEDGKGLSVREERFFGFSLLENSYCLNLPNGNTVELSSPLFRLLWGFAIRRGVVLTRDQILNVVYGNEVYVYDRAADSHVSNLRKELARHGGSQRIIRTVRSAGYLMPKEH